MKKLIVSEQQLDVDGYCSKNFEEFENIKLSSLFKWDQILFAFESMTQKKASMISIVAGTTIDVVVMCKNIDECMEHFRSIPNMNNSRSNIQFISELFENGDDIMIIPD